ncbi:hypothetical protein ABBQ32_008542 [Trebouxia sp. C0010 RCD-2024]
MADDEWEIFWCLDAWHPYRKRLQEVLPHWAKVRVLDTSKELHTQVANAKVLIPTTGLLPAKVINAAMDLRLIVNPAAGYNNIDIEAAQARGVPVCTSPGYNAASVAEGAIMMMLMLVRRVHEQQEVFRQQGGIGLPFGLQLHGKTLGIIGMGRIGVRLAKTAEAIGMKVTGLTSSSTRAELEALLQTADIVSLHCSLTPKTHGLIGLTELQMMKKGAFIVNYARADVIQKQALTDALMSGHLGGAGLDVHWVEPADPSDEIYQHPNVIATPHTGVASLEVLEQLVSVVCNNIVRRREGKELLHRLC